MDKDKREWLFNLDMKNKNKDLVIKFYKSEILDKAGINRNWYCEAEDLTDKQLKSLYETPMFSSWMLSNAYKDVVISLKEAIKKLFSKSTVKT